MQRQFLLNFTLVFGCGGATAASYGVGAVQQPQMFEAPSGSSSRDGSYSFSEGSVSEEMTPGMQTASVSSERSRRSEPTEPEAPSNDSLSFGARVAQPATPTLPTPVPSTNAAATATANAHAAPDRAEAIVIYTAVVWIAVYGVEDAKRALRTAIEARGGYIAEEADRQVVLRVPAMDLQRVLEGFGALGDVQRRTLDSTDVTEEYRDIDIRIRNLQQVRLRLEAVLARATTVEDTLRVEQELRRITEELERMEGRMRYLRDRVSLSTVTVIFTDRDTERPNRRVALPFPWLDQLGLSHLLQN